MRNYSILLALVFPLWAMGQWTVVGSDLISPAVEHNLQAFGEHNEVKIQMDFIGSVPAKEKLREGAAQLAILAAPNEADLPVGNYKSIPIAYEVAFVVVDKLNPLTEISMEQLAAIYGTTSADYSRWGDLGLQGQFASRSITPLALDNDTTVVLELFKFEALDSGSLKPNVARVKSNIQLMDLVSSDSGTIGVTNRLIHPEKIRALQISSKDEFAFGPSPENVHYGQYPLCLSYYLVYDREKQDELRPILRMLLSDGQAEAFERQGFVPLPENVRKRTLVELDKGS